MYIIIPKLLALSFSWKKITLFKNMTISFMKKQVYQQQKLVTK